MLRKSSFALSLLVFASPVSTPVLTTQTKGVDAAIDGYGTDASGAIVPSANTSDVHIATGMALWQEFSSPKMLGCGVGHELHS